MNVFNDLGFKNRGGKVEVPNSELLNGKTIKEIKQEVLDSSSTYDMISDEDPDGLVYIKSSMLPYTIIQEEGQDSFVSCEVYTESNEDVSYDIIVNEGIAQLEHELKGNDVTVVKMISLDSEIFVLLSTGQIKHIGLLNEIHGFGQGLSNNNLGWIDSSLTDVVDIVGANNSLYALKSNGDLMVCGKNYYGQLGLGDTEDRNYWELSLTGVSKLFSSKQSYKNYNRMYVQMNDGKLMGTGYNLSYCLGDETNINQLSWVYINNFTNVNKIEFTVDSTLLLLDNGNFYVIGNDVYGRIGNRNATTSSWILKDTSVTDIALGYYTSAYVKNGYPHYTGYYTRTPNTSSINEYTQYTAIGNTVKNVYIDYNNYMLFHLTNNYLYGAGYQSYGQFGFGHDDLVSTLKLIRSDVESVYFNDYNLVVKTTGNILYGAGYNSYGQLGVNSNGVERDRFVDMGIIGVSDVMICANQNIIVYTNYNSNLYGAGNNYYDQLNQGDVLSRPSFQSMYLPEIIGHYREYNRKNINASNTVTIASTGEFDGRLKVKLWTEL